MSVAESGDRSRAMAELALRWRIREHPEKWAEALRGDAAVAGWFEDQVRVAIKRDDHEVVGVVVQLAIMAARRAGRAEERPSLDGQSELTP